MAGAETAGVETAGAEMAGAEMAGVETVAMAGVVAAATEMTGTLTITSAKIPMSRWNKLMFRLDLVSLCTFFITCDGFCEIALVNA